MVKNDVDKDDLVFQYTDSSKEVSITKNLKLLAKMNNIILYR